MPLVRIEMLAGRSAEYRNAVGDAVHRALVETMGVTDDDRYQLFSEHSAANFNYARGSPPPTRTESLIVISITLNLGRTPAMKRASYQRVVDLLREGVGLAPDDVFIGLIEVARKIGMSCSGAPLQLAPVWQWGQFQGTGAVFDVVVITL